MAKGNWQCPAQYPIEIVFGATIKFSHPRSVKLTVKLYALQLACSSLGEYFFEERRARSCASFENLFWSFKLSLTYRGSSMPKTRERPSRSTRASSLEKELAPSTGRIMANMRVNKIRRCLEGHVTQLWSDMTFLWLVFPALRDNHGNVRLTPESRLHNCFSSMSSNAVELIKRRSTSPPAPIKHLEGDGSAISH